MKQYLSQVKRLQSDFDLFSLSHVSRSGNTHADSLAALATSSAGGLSRIILIEHLDKANKVAKGTVHMHEVKMGLSWMDPIVRFLKNDILPEEKSKAEKYEETLIGSSCPRTINCISTPILGLIYCAFTLKHQNYYLKSCTKESVGVTQKEDLCRIEPLPKDIGGRGCRRKPYNMLRNVTTAKGLPQISISQEGSSTLCPVHGHSPSGA